MEIIERGDSSDLVKAYRTKYKIAKDAPDKELFENKGFQEKMGRLLQLSVKSGIHGNVLRSAPRFARVAPAAGVPGYEKLTPDLAVGKAVGEARSQHTKNWEQEELKDPAVIKSCMERGRDFLQSIANQVKGAHKVMLEEVAKEYKNFTNTISSSVKNTFADKEFEKFAIEYMEKTGKEKLSSDEMKKIRAEFNKQVMPEIEWKMFRRENEKEGRKGFFEFIESPRAKEQGWTKETIMEMAKKPPKDSSPPSGPAPSIGETIGIKPPPKAPSPGAPEEPPRRPGTIREALRRRNK
jgi:hypothetical protein